MWKKRYFRLIAFTWLLCLSGAVGYAQAQIDMNVTVVVKPPVSSVFSEYADLSNRIIVTIQNTYLEDVDNIVLRGRLADFDREYGISTRDDYIPAQRLSFRAFETKTIMIDPIQLRFLQANAVEFNSSGLQEEVMRTGLLPEGNWNLCVSAIRITDINQWQNVSSEACFPLNITRANAPVITSPYNQQIIPSQQPNVVFAWTPPAGNTIGAQVVYDLYAVKVLPGQSPDEAMNAAVNYKANNPLVKTNLTGNQYVTQPFDLPLDTGATYAVQVVARDLNRQVAFQNDGRSEVVVFDYGNREQITISDEGDAFSFTILSPSKDSDTIVVSNQQDFYLNWGWLLRNNLFNPDTVNSFRDKNIRSYRILLLPGARKSGRNIDAGFSYQTTKETGIPGSGNNYAVDFYQSGQDNLINIGMKDNFWYRARVEAVDDKQRVIASSGTHDFNLRLSSASESGSVQVAGQLRYQFDGYAENYPIPNTPVRIYAENSLPGVNETFTKTDDNGNFQAAIPASLAPTNVPFRIEIIGDYYRQIDTAVFNLSDTISKISIGQLVTRAYNYSLTVRVQKGFSNYRVAQNHSYYDSHGDLVERIDTVLVGIADTAIQQLQAGITVKLYRKKRPSYLPPVEGMMNQTATDGGIIPVAEGKTIIGIDGDGKESAFVKFEKLLCNVFSDDVYYIRVMQPDGRDSEAFRDDMFEAPEQEFVFHRPTSAIDPTHFDVNTTYRIISKDPPKSSVSGQLLYRWPGDPGNTLRPLANQRFSIVVEYLLNGKPFRPREGIMENKLFMDGYEASAGREYNTGDAEQVMASGMTDADGRFTIQAMNLNEKGPLGAAEVISVNTMEKPPITRPVSEDLFTISPIANAVISPIDRTTVTSIDKIGVADGKSVFNQLNIGTSFGMQLQQSQLVGAMNPGLTFRSSTNQFQALGYYRSSGKVNLASSGSGLQSHSSITIHEYRADVKPLQRVYRIRLENQHFFYHPDKNIIVQPLEATDAGPITVMVKEVKVNVEVSDEKSRNQRLTPVQVIVFRNPATKVPDLPRGEGDGLYRMNELINPKFSGDNVSLPEKAPVSGGNILPASISQWQANMSQVPTIPDYLRGAPSWPENSYEWLADTTTNANGIASFNRLLSGFNDYYIEVATSPQAGSALFYDFNIQPLTDIQYDISPVENGRYWDERKKDIPTGTLGISMKPEASRVGGRVIDKSTGLGIKGSLIRVNLKSGQKEKTVLRLTQDTTGYFEILNVFEELDPGAGVQNIEVEINAFIKGYKQEGIKRSTVSRTGRQYVDNILMAPGGGITGFVKNETGEAVDAYIQRADGLSVSTGAAAPLQVKIGEHLINFVPDKGGDGQFYLPAPSGQEVTLYIIPKDAGYFRDTIKLSVKDGTNDLETVTVFRRKHRMRFTVFDNTANNLPYPVPVAGAKISVSKNLNIITNEQGVAELSFENVSVNNYTVRIEGPEGKGFIPLVTNLKNEESKEAHYYSVSLKKGHSVSGVVTLDGVPVKGAKVYLDYQQQVTQESLAKDFTFISGETVSESGDSPVSVSTGRESSEIAVFSDAQGRYQLSGIPFSDGTVRLIAILDTSFTVIGDEQTVSIPQDINKNLSLKSYKEMSVKTLFGFPITVEKLTPEQGTGNVKVTGKVDLSKGTSDFVWLNETQKQVRVSDIVFKPGNNNTGEPVEKEVRIDATSSLRLSYLDKYNVLLTKNGSENSAPELLTIEQNGSANGVVSGFVNIIDNSFNYPSSYLNFTEKDQFYLGRKNGSNINNKLNAIRAAGSERGSSSIYNLSNRDRGAIQFKFLEFKSTADPLNSFIDAAGKIHLDITMDCHIPNAQPEDFSVHAGEIILDDEKVYPSRSNAALTLKLEKWDVEIKDWTISAEKGGIYSENGLVKTGKIDIPFSEFNLRPDMLILDKFSVNQLKLGGGVKTIETRFSQKAMFVYDPKMGSDMQGHWKLAISGSGNLPAATISNISANGRDKTFLTQDINLEYVELLSNGEDILTIRQDAEPILIQQNGLARFRPSGIFSGADYFQVTGSLEIPAPRVIPVMATLQFTGSPTNMKMELKPLQMSFEGRGYVNFNSNSNLNSTITRNQIIIPGYVEEKNGINPITSTFFAEGNSASNASFHVDVQKDFVLNLTSDAPPGGRDGMYNLKLTGGGMQVPAGTNDWNLLSFTGNLQTSDNTLLTGNNSNENKMTFTVKGDVDVSGEGLKVTNIDLPFGKMELVYEFPNKRLLGSLVLNQNQQFGSFETGGGTINMEIGSKGWHLVGAVKINTHIPLIETVNTGFLIGNRNFSGDEWLVPRDMVSQFSYDKSSLCWLQDKGGTGSIRGIFMTGGVNLLDKRIGFGVEGVADFELIAKIGGEISQYANFDQWKYQLSTGVYGIVSVGASAVGVSANGKMELAGSFTGEASRSSVCIGGKAGANVRFSAVLKNPVKDIYFGSLEKSAVVWIGLSDSGLSKDFYFGSSRPPECNLISDGCAN